MNLGVYELAYRYDIPYKVIIDESINLTKIFGGQDSHRLINSVLDVVSKKVRKLECGGSVSATWFGLGLVPYAPGTFGSLGALPLAWVMLTMVWKYQLLVYFFVLLLSYAAAHHYGLIVQNSDHRSIVCDEVCGLLPVLLFFMYRSGC